MSCTTYNFRNDFAQLVGEEYLKFFNFADMTLDMALREFLKHLTVSGETQERERVLAHFSHGYMQFNPKAFNSDGMIHYRLIEINRTFCPMKICHNIVITYQFVLNFQENMSFKCKVYVSI